MILLIITMIMMLIMITTMITIIVAPGGRAGASCRLRRRSMKKGERGDPNGGFVMVRLKATQCSSHDNSSGV